MNGLSVSMQNYIKAVYELSSCGEGAHISDIAAKVGVTKASTCVAVKTLQKKKLVYRNAYRPVFLTKEGEHQAVLALDKAAIIRKFFIDVLGVEPGIADADAKALAHIVSIKTLCCLCRFNHKTSVKRQCLESCHLQRYRVCKK